MTLLLAIVVGVLYAAGIYLMMDRNMIRLILGLALISHAANLLIFTAGRLDRGRPPLITAAGEIPVGADAVPQALILTAIVISFGVLAFAMALVYRSYQVFGTEDLDTLKKMER
jgi:multicomponent Na+:H+ antiporter subunit C